MDPQLQAGAARRLEDLARLVGREHAGLAEDVAPFGELPGGDRRNHLVDDEVDVRPPMIAVLDRDFVRAHERRRRCRSACAAVEIAQDLAASSARLRSSARSRSSPRTSSCRSAASRRGDGACRAASSAVCRRPRRADGADDAAAAAGDLRIGGAGEPPPQLVAPIAGERRRACARSTNPGTTAPPPRVDDGRAVRKAAPALPVCFRSDEDDHAVRPRRRRRARSIRRRLAQRRVCGAGPAQVRISEVLWIRKSADHARLL